jgi:hypothetical protein
MKTPEEAARELALRTTEEIRRMMPLVQVDAALEACFHVLLRLLIAKGTLEAQEALDAFETLSGELQFRRDNPVGVLTLERLCSMLAALPGAKRPMA